MKVLLLEDDEILNELIEEFLISLNFYVISIYDGQEALEVIYEDSFDLLLLDVNVPLLSGFDLCKDLKRNKIDIPIIFITSLHTVDDVLLGFKLGANDYIKKPFHLNELEVRINNIKRLRQIEVPGELILDENISYNYNSKIIRRLGIDYILSKTESKIFEYLLKNRNIAISIEEISVNNWIYDEMPIPTTIRTYIKNLRKILGKDMITTIKGVGYKLNN